jgi:hypothetical protein
MAHDARGLIGQVTTEERMPGALDGKMQVAGLASRLTVRTWLGDAAYRQPCSQLERVVESTAALTHYLNII